MGNSKHNLPAPRGGPAIAGADPGVTRREFLRNVLLLTGAGLAAGSAAALGKEQWAAGQAALAATETLRAQVNDSAQQIELLQGSLQAAQAALEELRPQLSSALTENAGLQNGLLEKQKEADGLRGQLSEAQSQISNLRQLVALYDDLEASGLDTAIVNGLASAAVGFATALGLLPLVSNGIALARSLFETFEGQFPVFRSGLNWLEERLASLNDGITAVETAAEQAVQTLNPAASRLAQLIDYILAHLPFGIGKSIKAALIALNDLYHSLPDLILGANAQVIDTLTVAFGEGATSLGQTFLKPIREHAFNPVERLTGEFNSLYDSFVGNLHDPVVGVLDQRNAIRQQITAFREANHL